MVRPKICIVEIYFTYFCEKMCDLKKKDLGVRSMYWISKSVNLEKL
jgi:hypothetical protein